MWKFIIPYLFFASPTSFLSKSFQGQYPNSDTSTTFRLHITDFPTFKASQTCSTPRCKKQGHDDHKPNDSLQSLHLKSFQRQQFIRTFISSFMISSYQSANGFTTNPTTTHSNLALDKDDIFEPKHGSPDNKMPSICNSNVSILTKDHRVIYLVGTSHISAISANIASHVVHDIKPGAIFLELDLKRITKAFQDGEIESNVKIAFRDRDGVFRYGRTESIASNFNPLMSIFRNLQTKYNSRIGTDTKNSDFAISFGEEFILAMKKAIEIGAIVIFGDQDLDITLLHLGTALLRTKPNDYSKAEEKMTSILTESATRYNITLQQLNSNEPMKKIMIRVQNPMEWNKFIESIREPITVKKMMKIMQECTPEIYNALVSERDEYMATGLNELPPQMDVIVAIMGIAHVDGVSERLYSLGWREETKRYCQEGKVF